MAIKNIQLEGHGDIDIVEIICVCGSCKNSIKENALLEFNFLEQKIYYICTKCKHNNILDMSKQQSSPYPKSKSIR